MTTGSILGWGRQVAVWSALSRRHFDNDDANLTTGFPSSPLSPSALSSGKPGLPWSDLGGSPGPSGLPQRPGSSFFFLLPPGLFSRASLLFGFTSPPPAGGGENILLDCSRKEPAFLPGRGPFPWGQMRVSPCSSPPKLSCLWPLGLSLCWSRSGWLHWFARAAKSSQGVGEGRLRAPFVSFSCCKRPSLACLFLCTGWLLLTRASQR